MDCLRKLSLIGKVIDGLRQRKSFHVLKLFFLPSGENWIQSVTSSKSLLLLLVGSVQFSLSVFYLFNLQLIGEFYKILIKPSVLYLFAVRLWPKRRSLRGLFTAASNALRPWTFTWGYSRCYSNPQEVSVLPTFSTRPLYRHGLSDR